VSLRRDKHQKTAQAELPLEARGEALHGQRSGEARTAIQGKGGSGTAALMERVVDSRNLKAALKRVRQSCTVESSATKSSSDSTRRSPNRTLFAAGARAPKVGMMALEIASAARST
jgi:hypothetical protein